MLCSTRAVCRVGAPAASVACALLASGEACEAVAPRPEAVLPASGCAAAGWATIPGTLAGASAGACACGGGVLVGAAMVVAAPVVPAVVVSAAPPVAAGEALCAALVVEAEAVLLDGVFEVELDDGFEMPLGEEFCRPWLFFAPSPEPWSDAEAWLAGTAAGAVAGAGDEVGLTTIAELPGVLAGLVPKAPAEACAGAAAAAVGVVGAFSVAAGRLVVDGISRSASKEKALAASDCLVAAPDAGAPCAAALVGAVAGCVLVAAVGAGVSTAVAVDVVLVTTAAAAGVGATALVMAARTDAAVTPCDADVSCAGDASWLHALEEACLRPEVPVVVVPALLDAPSTSSASGWPAKGSVLASATTGKGVGAVLLGGCPTRWLVGWPVVLFSASLFFASLRVAVEASWASWLVAAVSLNCWLKLVEEGVLPCAEALLEAAVDGLAADDAGVAAAGSAIFTPVLGARCEPTRDGAFRKGNKGLRRGTPFCEPGNLRPAASFA